MNLEVQLSQDKARLSDTRKANAAHKMQVAALMAERDVLKEEMWKMQSQLDENSEYVLPIQRVESGAGEMQHSAAPPMAMQSSMAPVMQSSPAPKVQSAPTPAVQGSSRSVAQDLRLKAAAVMEALVQYLDSGPNLAQPHNVKPTRTSYIS